MGYKEPILVEIFLELHLPEGRLTPASFFDLVPALKEEFPEVEIQQVENIALYPAVGEVTRTATPRVRCWSKERTRLVQLSPDLVVVNQVGQYLGWKAFEDHFGSVKAVLDHAMGRVDVTSISLNTLDSMVTPREGFAVGTYLNCGGNVVPGWYRDATSSCDITLGRGVLRDDGFNRQIRIAIRVDATQAQIKMNAVFHDKLGPGVSIDQNLDRLHKESNRTFEDIITATTRQRMGGRT